MATAIFPIPQALPESYHSLSGDRVNSLSGIETMEVTRQHFRDAVIKSEMASIWLILSREACPQNPGTMLQGCPDNMEETCIGVPANSPAEVSPDSQHSSADM